MIHPDDALNTIINSAVVLGCETIKVINSNGRILYNDIYSNIDLPGFNKSAMDGYAYNSKDNLTEYELVEVIPAGHIPEIKLKKGQCSKIMTGAMLPEGADRVIRVEYTEQINSKVYFNKPDDCINICYKGENLKNGDRVLEKGTLIRTQEIAALSTIGLADVMVYKQPVVGVITTGSELLEPGDEMQPGKIYNSNSIQLFNQITSIPVKCVNMGIVEDNEQATVEAFKKALQQCDILIISGGVSMGDFDYVPLALRTLSVDLKFEKLAIKPGKPTVFGVRNNTYVFGLPGNPVSTFVIFDIFVKPFIYKLMGHSYLPLIIKAKLAERFKRKNADRYEYLPVMFDGELVNFVTYHGSGHINALSGANALMKIDKDVNIIEKGTIVSVRQI